MKKQLFLSLLAMLTISGSVMAQEALSASPTEQVIAEKSPKELSKEILLMLHKELTLTNEQSSKSYAPFFEYFTAKQNAINEMHAAGITDKESIAAQTKELVRERDGKLRNIFTEQQLFKWKRVIEPAMKAKQEKEAINQ